MTPSGWVPRVPSGFVEVPPSRPNGNLTDEALPGDPGRMPRPAVRSLRSRVDAEPDARARAVVAERDARRHVVRVGVGVPVGGVVVGALGRDVGPAVVVAG